MISFCVAFFLLCSSSLINGQQPILRDPGLLQRPRSNLILTLHNPTGPVLQQVASTTYPNRVARLQALTTALRTATTTWQAPVLAALRTQNIQATPYWVTNQIYVRNANPAIVTFLRGVTGIREIAEEIILPILPVFNPTVGTPPNGTEWNVRMVGAEQVWPQSRGQGIVVGGKNISCK